MPTNRTDREAERVPRRARSVVAKRNQRHSVNQDECTRSFVIVQSDSLALPTSLFTWRCRLSSNRPASQLRWCQGQVLGWRKCIRSRSWSAERSPTETHNRAPIIPFSRLVRRSSAITVPDKLLRPMPSVPSSTVARRQRPRSNRPACCWWSECGPCATEATRTGNRLLTMKSIANDARIASGTYTNQSMVKRSDTL